MKKNRKSAIPAEQAVAVEVPKAVEPAPVESPKAEEPLVSVVNNPAPIVGEVKAEETPKAESKPVKKSKRTKAAKVKAAAPKLTKKLVCLELVSREGGATIDEMAEAIKERGISADLTVNKTTAGLWMSKLTDDAGNKVPVEKNKETGKYTRKVAAVTAVNS